MADRMTTEQLLERRMALLEALYDEVNGDTLAQVDFVALGASIELAEVESERIFDWLRERDLAGIRTMGQHMHITPRGMDVVEEWRRSQEDEAASSGAAAGQVLTLDEARLVEPLISALQALVKDRSVKLEDQVRIDLDAQAATLAAQVRSPRPRRAIVAAVVASVKWTADGIGQAVVGAAAMGAISAAWKVFG